MWIWVLWVVGVASAAGGGLESSPELTWLLANEAPPPPLSLRRITPKSVFVAPAFTSCSEGYRPDSLGRCVKVVKINQQAQWDFFLQKLNAMYAPPVKDKPQQNGPFRVPIPIAEAETTTEPAPTTMMRTEESLLTTTSPPPTTTELTGTETPLLIIVANTTETPSTTEKEWTQQTTQPPTTESPGNGTAATGATESPTVVTVTSADCEGCYPTSEPSTAETDRAATIVYARPADPTNYRDDEGFTISYGRPEQTTSTYPEYLPPSTEPPTPPPTRRSTVRFPSSSSYVRFPAQQQPVWWPPSWEQSLWPQQWSSSKPWSHREPRPSWTQP